MTFKGDSTVTKANLIIKPVGEGLQFVQSADPDAEIRRLVNDRTDSVALYRSNETYVRMHVDDNGFAKELPPNFPYPGHDYDVPGLAAFTCDNGDDYVSFDEECTRVVRDVIRGLTRPQLPPDSCDPIGEFWGSFSYSGSRNGLILLPLSRFTCDDRIYFDDNSIIIYGPELVNWESLGVVLEPKLFKLDAANTMPLEWAKNWATGITLEHLRGSALCALVVPIDPQQFMSGSHAYHAELIRNAADRVEELLDVIRFEHCGVRLPEALPGRAGHVERSWFSAAIIYLPGSPAGALIGNAVETHAIIGGLGLEAPTGSYERIRGGEVAMILRRGLAMFSEFLGASRQTQQFMLGMSLLEFLASPDEYTQMKDVKREIATHAARSKTEYHEICERVLELTSKDGPTTGLRTRIIHYGQTFEDAIPNRTDRVTILEELERFARACLHDLFEQRGRSWTALREWRTERRLKLGIS